MFLFVLDISVCQGQTVPFKEQQFFEKLQNSYYYLESTKTKNFTALLTNSATEQFAKTNWKNSEIFPLQVIWFAPNRIFLSEKGVPALNDSLKNIYSQHIQNLKIKVQDLLINLRQFYFNGFYNSISENYQILQSNDLVNLKFEKVSKSDTVKYAYQFGLNGLCLKITATSESDGTIVETIPVFKIVKTQWLIVGWSVKVIKNDVIQSGYAVSLKNSQAGKIWVPIEIIISVQDVNHLGKTFSDVLKIRNYLFDQSLQIMN